MTGQGPLHNLQAAERTKEPHKRKGRISKLCSEDCVQTVVSAAQTSIA